MTLSVPATPVAPAGARLARSTLVGEVVMKRTMTPLPEAARLRGGRFQVGTDMLYEQIPLYLELFGYGRPAPERAASDRLTPCPVDRVP
jgi:shikimate dehydrogenase